MTLYKGLELQSEDEFKEIWVVVSGAYVDDYRTMHLSRIHVESHN
jgi:hypothetical protein